MFDRVSVRPKAPNNYKSECGTNRVPLREFAFKRFNSTAPGLASIDNADRAVLFGFLDSSFHAGESLFELAADHLFHIHQQAERFADEVILTGHCPRDLGVWAFGLKRELDVTGVFKRTDEVQANLNSL